MKVEEVIKKMFSLPEDFRLSGETGPGNTPGWDSLGHINLISALESEYEVSFDINEIVSLESIDDIKKKLKQKGVVNFE